MLFLLLQYHACIYRKRYNKTLPEKPDFSLEAECSLAEICICMKSCRMQLFILQADFDFISPEDYFCVFVGLVCFGIKNIFQQQQRISFFHIQKGSFSFGGLHGFQSFQSLFPLDTVVLIEENAQLFLFQSFRRQCFTVGRVYIGNMYTDRASLDTAHPLDFKNRRFFGKF